MAIYCPTSKTAIVNWQFTGKPAQKFIAKAPINLTIEPALGNDSVLVASGFITNLNSSGDDYHRTLSFNNNLLNYISQFSVEDTTGQVIIDGITYYSKTARFSATYIPIILDPPVRVYNNSTIVIFDSYGNHALSPYYHLSFMFKSYSTNGYKIEITDKLGRKISETGIGQPAWDVKCSGCPPNNLDCGGCCLDCANFKQKLGEINERLQ